jgi:hypothetical protein
MLAERIPPYLSLKARFGAETPSGDRISDRSGSG